MTGAAHLTTDPAIVVAPFTIVVDSREQAPYQFSDLPLTGRDRGKRLIVPVVVRGLPAGDYSIDGLERVVAVERKSLEDLYGTLAAGRGRFEREIERLSELEFAAVVIEADVREVWRPAEFHPGWRSKLNPRSVEGTIVAWSVRYPGVHWWFMGSRRAAEVRVWGVLERVWRERQGRI